MRWAIIATCAIGLAERAAACEPQVTVGPGETFFSIAEEQLGDLSLWSAIFYANPNVQGGGLLDIQPGTVLTIPCPDAPAPVAEPAPQTEPAPPNAPVLEAAPAAPSRVAPLPRRAQDIGISLLARAGHPPFSDANWPAQGMLSELVTAALDATPNAVPYSLSWEGDWSRHLFPQLDGQKFDMGFPVFKPDCDAEPTLELCTAFHFSDPVVDIVTLLFTRTDDPITFATDEDLHGKTLCRPAGYFTHDLDRADRRWLSQGLVTLVQPATTADCFTMLLDKQVDAVALDEFLGVQKLFELDLTARVTPLPRPVSVEGLHVVISKTHWRGTAHLFRFNAGLAKLKQTERFNRIVSRHLALFWDQVKS